jgi:transcriptional regulator with XRE-family HTH domain
MTITPTTISLRGRKLGVLIREARLSSGTTAEECARAIGVTLEKYESYENGELSPSLPEMELLAFSLDIPFEHFLGDSTLSDSQNAAQKINAEQLIRLRQRLIGVLIRQGRMENSLSLEALAEKTGISTRNLAEYEMGEAAVPLPELEILASALNRPIRDFQDKHGPIGAWATHRRAIQELKEMPPELQIFICKPINRPYLELAQRLSEMSVEKLRAVAEGLLEITL